MTAFVKASPLGARKSTSNRSSFLRHTTALFLILAGGLAVVLFSVKYQVHDLEAEHQRLVAELDDERRALHVLRAEWANLNDPIRIQALAERYLAMQPMRPGQVTSVSGVQDIPYRQAAQPEQGEGTNETP